MVSTILERTMWIGPSASQLTFAAKEGLGLIPFWTHRKDSAPSPITVELPDFAKASGGKIRHDIAVYQSSNLPKGIFAVALGCNYGVGYRTIQVQSWLKHSDPEAYRAVLKIEIQHIRYCDALASALIGAIVAIAVVAFCRGYFGSFHGFLPIGETHISAIFVTLSAGIAGVIANLAYLSFFEGRAIDNSLATLTREELVGYDALLVAYRRKYGFSFSNFSCINTHRKFCEMRIQKGKFIPHDEDRVVKLLAHL